MLDELRQRVCQANLALVREGLVIQTWGNVSAVDRAGGCMVIKPSGVSYDGMHAGQMVVVSLETGEVVEGDLRPSSDAPTHLELYRAWAGIGGVVHTHSLYATAWAQAGRDLPALGTTHADYFHGPVPCTRAMSPEEIRDDYEANTGRLIARRFTDLDPLHIPAVLVAAHGPFTWGASVEQAIQSAILLEHLCRMAILTLQINPTPPAFNPALLDKHYLRKHGPGAYYGQKGDA